MKQRELLDFLRRLECLKTNGRHSTTVGGITETVAAHSWRLAVLALLIAPEFPELDGNKLIRMCLIHDFGEAITGDIPSFLKTKEHEATEDNAVQTLLSTLPEPQRGSLGTLFAEMDAHESTEARLYKALDKLEAVIQHNESDISTWLPLEYELQQTYAVENASEFPYLKELRALMLEDTLKKIEDAKEK
ncbi:MAG: HD domain-containing protein [Alphaproteobacteria bacterium]|nr:HD domain-containing protein [Alphaproteobacteria bacterium]